MTKMFSRLFALFVALTSIIRRSDLPRGRLQLGTIVHMNVSEAPFFQSLPRHSTPHTCSALVFVTSALANWTLRNSRDTGEQSWATLKGPFWPVSESESESVQSHTL